jgi:hypothetical protein
LVNIEKASEGTERLLREPKNEASVERGYRTVFAIGFSACLAASLGFSPFLYIFHITFASHGHRYCLEHRQIEDVERDEQGIVGVVKSSEDSSQIGFNADTNASGPALKLHLACEVSNSYSQRKDFISDIYRYAIAYIESATYPANTSNPGAPLYSLVLLAPKQSPPLAV